MKWKLRIVKDEYHEYPWQVDAVMGEPFKYWDHDLPEGVEGRKYSEDWVYNFDSFEVARDFAAAVVDLLGEANFCHKAWQAFAAADLRDSIGVALFA